jgi:hypothetical protein
MWNCRLIDFLDFSEAAPAKKTKDRALRAKAELVVSPKWGITMDRLPIDRNHTLAGQILDPILILVEKNLDVSIQDRRMVKNEITRRTFPDRDGRLFERKQGGAILDDDRSLCLLSDNLTLPCRLSWSR